MDNLEMQNSADKRPTAEQRAAGAANGWSGEELERGYAIINFDGAGLLEIEAIGDMGVFDSDEEAVEQAIRDGYKFIPVEELPLGFDLRYPGWLDTPENRKAISDYAFKHSEQGAATRFLEEAGLQLRRAGFATETTETNEISVTFGDAPLCTLTGKDVRYDRADIEGGRNEAFQRVLDITHTVGEYMRSMESGPRIEAESLHEDFRLLAEYNGIVLAGHKFIDVPGHQFATWERAYDRKGLCVGNYFDDYSEAKQDFATRSGLVQKDHLFTDEQLAETYRCIHETLDSGYPITPEREKLLRETAEQIERAVPDLDQRVELSNQKELIYGEQFLDGPKMG